MQFIFLALLIYLNVSVYREVRRNEKQIIANQVSTERLRRSYSRIRKLFTTQLLYFLQFFFVISQQISLLLSHYLL